MVNKKMYGKIIVSGTAQGEVLRLSEPLSLWGGLNPETGEIIDRHHLNSGDNVTGKIIVMPSGRGSSSASSILLEAVRQKKAPAGIILAESDGILALGAVVAREIYEVDLPVIEVNPQDYEKLASYQHLTINPDGTITIVSD